MIENTKNLGVKIGGLYQHFKGMKYRVISVGKHSETLEEMVIYETLYENPNGKIWVRPLKMFVEIVKKDGAEFPRFQLIKD